MAETYEPNESEEFDVRGDPVPVVVMFAEALREDLRSITHLSLPGQSLPAPLVYAVLGNLKGLGHLLPQTCRQLAAGMGRSLNTFEVYEDDGRDPVQSIAAAADHLTRAAQLAGQLGVELAQAQSAISGQSYREKDTQR